MRARKVRLRSVQGAAEKWTSGRGVRPCRAALLLAADDLADLRMHVVGGHHPGSHGLTLVRTLRLSLSTKCEGEAGWLQ